MKMNPMQMFKSMYGNNPMFQRAMQMAEGKSEDEIKQVINNVCQQRGVNVQQALGMFKSQFGSMLNMR